MARTEEEKKAWGQKMKLAREAKKNAVAIDSSGLGDDPRPEEPIPVPDKIPAARRAHVPKHIPLKIEAASSLIHELANIPIDEISFDDCGAIINACAAATQTLSAARTRKQEQLDAGTRRAPCTTCGRMIDITKSGGFQILTIRDEHFQPRNVYFCSQNCLLSRNMPSHAKAESERLKRQRAGATA